MMLQCSRSFFSRRFALVSAILAAVAGVATLTAPAPGHAADTFSSMSGTQLSNIIQGMGYKAELTTDSQGDPKISSAAEGVKYVILTYGCTNPGNGKRCNSFQFSAGFSMRSKPSLDLINEWNRTKRFGKAYLDNERDPIVEWDVDIRGGVTSDFVRECVNRWTKVLSEFKLHIKW